MANYATLKAAISQVIKENGNKEITGAVMQTTLLAMVDSMASGYTFAGVATPSTSAGTPDENVFWIGGAGSYSNFGTSTINVPTGCICIFTYNGSFASSILYVGGVVDISKLTNTSYASLSQALADVPSFLQVSGLEIMYQDSTSGNYVKYRLMATSWSTTVSDWQGVDDEPTFGSDNLVKSGGVKEYILPFGINEIQTQAYEEISTNGYINTSGTFVPHSSAKTTEPISLSRGEVIIIDCSASSLVSIISSMVVGTNTYYSPKVFGMDGRHVYYYIAEDDCNIAISYVNIHSLKKATISNYGVINLLTLLNNRYNNNVVYRNLAAGDLTLGGFYRANGEVVSFTDCYYTNNVKVYSGITIKLIKPFIADYSVCLLYGKDNTIKRVIDSSSLDSEGNLLLTILDGEYYLNTSWMLKNLPASIEIVGGIIELEDKIIDSKISDAAEISKTKTQVEITKETGYFISAQGRILAFSGYFYSDLITLNRGQTIAVTAKDASGANVAKISKWTQNGSICVGVEAVGTTIVTTSTYTASDDEEYIRVSGQESQPMDVRIITTAASNDLKKVINDEIESYDILAHVMPKPSVSMYERVGFCGDSYVKGSLYVNNTYIGDRPKLAWGSCMARQYGIEAEIYASGGADTNTWQSRYDCLPLALSDTPCDLYIFCFGINDYAYVTKGTIADITNYESYEDYPNTFYGNYGKIIEQLMAHSPNCKMILMPPYQSKISPYYTWAKPAVVEIAEHYGIAVVDTADSLIANSVDFVNGKMLDGGHPTAPTHSAMGADIANLIGVCMANNDDYFKTFIGRS